MSSTELPSPSIGEPEDPVAAIFHRGGARKINALLRRLPESRTRSRANNSGRTTPFPRRRSGATPGSLQQGSHQAAPRRSRRRQQNDARVPPVVNNSQRQPDRPPTHEGQRAPQSTEDSLNRFSRGQYGPCEIPTLASGIQISGQEGHTTGAPIAMARMATTTESGLMRDKRIEPYTVRQLPINGHLSCFNGQPLHQPMMPSTPAMDMNFPTTLPANHRANLTLTGPNGIPQAYACRWNAKSELSFISVDTAYSLGAILSVYPPGQPTDWSPVGEMTPACFVENISVNSELLQVRGLQVTLHVVRGIEEGYGIVIGRNMMAMMGLQIMA